MRYLANGNTFENIAMVLGMKSGHWRSIMLNSSPTMLNDWPLRGIQDVLVDLFGTNGSTGMVEAT